MKNRNDEAAFPVPIGNTDERQWGMSLRDWFAGMAMQGRLASGDDKEYYQATVANDCYRQADEMMEAREAKQ